MESYFDFSAASWPPLSVACSRVRLNLNRVAKHKRMLIQTERRRTHYKKNGDGQVSGHVTRQSATRVPCRGSSQALSAAAIGGGVGNHTIHSTPRRLTPRLGGGSHNLSRTRKSEAAQSASVFFSVTQPPESGAPFDATRRAGIMGGSAAGGAPV
jgi:hypothetical protein